MNRNEVSPNKEFMSSDLFLVAYLLCSGLKLLSTNRENPRKTIFILNDTTKRTSLVTAYFSNRAKVDPLEYKAKISDLKSLLYNS